MQIKMKTMMAGPEGCRNVGDVVDVDDREGLALVSGNYAEDMTPKRAEAQPVDDVPETATQPKHETATAPVQRRGRK